MAKQSEGYLFHVDPTSIMLFASALGETNPIYYDDEFARTTPLGRVIASPTFAIAAAHWNPSYPLRGIRKIPLAPPRPVAPPAGLGEESGGGEAGALARGLHGEQRFQYHKNLEPGMHLRVTTRRGSSWEKQGRRGGVMKFSESVTEYRDTDGELVVTATSVGITTSKLVEG